MIGVRATETDDAFGTGAIGGFEMLNELEPLVTADQWVNLIEAQDGDFNIGGGEPVELQEFKRSLRRQKHKHRMT